MRKYGLTTRHRALGSLSVLVLLSLWSPGAAMAGGLPLAVRGAHTVHLWPPATGGLTVTVSKRDLNIYTGKDDVLLSLTDSARRLVASGAIPDDGNAGKGPAGTKVLKASLKVSQSIPGAYRLVVAAGSGGSDFVFGLSTNASRVVLEGEPLLNTSSLAGKVYFSPPAGAFSAKAMALHKPGCQSVPLRDAKGAVVKTFTLCDASGGAGTWKSASVAASAGDRSGPWRFDVGKLDVRLGVDKVKHWSFSAGELYDVARARWLLLPYTFTRALKPGQGATYSYTLRNSTGAAAKVALKAQCASPMTCAITSPASPVSLASGGTQQVALKVSAGAGAKAGATLWGRLTATVQGTPHAVQSAWVRVLVGPSPVGSTLKTPIVNRRYQHENYQFGYAPGYVANEAYFDGGNVPFIRHRTENIYRTDGLTLLEGGKWVKRDYLPSIKAAYPSFMYFYGGGGFAGAKVAFDGKGGAYTQLRMIPGSGSQKRLLVFTPDRGKTYSLHPFDGTAFDIEQFTGHNAPAGAPPFLAYKYTAPHSATYCSYHDLLLYLPKRAGSKLSLGKPVTISKNCLGSCQHSGGPGSLVTRGGKTHVVWGEVSKTGKDPGVPTYIATYDHKAGKLSKAVFLDYGPPVDDVHNVPAITMDSKGLLHVVTGAHGSNFKYMRSLKPNNALGGWTKPVKVLEAGWVDSTTDKDGKGRQTYISLVCDKQDNLHIAFRQWRRSVDKHFPGNYYAALSVQKKAPGKAWGPAVPLVVPPVAGYSIYYHKLTVDRRGALYLSYNHWTSDTTYQGDFPDRHHHRALLTSTDGAKTWRLATTADFLAGLPKPPKPDAGPADTGPTPDLDAASVDAADDLLSPDKAAPDRATADRAATLDAPANQEDALPSVDHGGSEPGEADDGCSCQVGKGDPLATGLLLLLLALLRSRARAGLNSCRAPSPGTCRTRRRRAGPGGRPRFPTGPPGNGAG